MKAALLLVVALSCDAGYGLAPALRTPALRRHRGGLGAAAVGEDAAEERDALLAAIQAARAESAAAEAATAAATAEGERIRIEIGAAKQRVEDREAAAIAALDRTSGRRRLLPVVLAVVATAIACVRGLALRA